MVCIHTNLARAYGHQTHQSFWIEKLDTTPVCPSQQPTLESIQKRHLSKYLYWQEWASYQIRKIAVCACVGECRERFSRHWLRRKPLVSDPAMHHGTCVTHVPWCMSVSLTRGGGENVPGLPGACATRNFTNLLRGSWKSHEWCKSSFIYRIIRTDICTILQFTIMTQMFLDTLYVYNVIHLLHRRRHDCNFKSRYCRQILEVRIWCINLNTTL